MYYLLKVGRLCVAGILKLNKHIRRKITSLHNTKTLAIARVFIYLQARATSSRERGAKLFGMTIDQIVNYEGNIPTEVSIEDKNINERLLLIEQLEEEDKNAIYRIIDGMLTKSKFKDFFNKNVAAL
ncbi:hypothetical protein D3C71_18430 [compost metagenome]